MPFEVSRYSAEVQAILALDSGGARPMALAGGQIVQAGVDAIAGRGGAKLFPGSPHPDAALAGLYLYFSANDIAHSIAQDISSVEGSFWHGILHRQEPDPNNAKYWFRRVGRHAIFPALHEEARRLGYPVKASWDPIAFIDDCETARRKPGSQLEQTAMAVQLTEWQLLFDHCARAES